MAPRHIAFPVRVQRIEDAIVGLACLSAAEQRCLPRTVVQERVADASARWERGKITALHRIEVTVNPRIDLAVEYVDELLFLFLGMRP
jgi:hypothetical protein